MSYPVSKIIPITERIRPTGLGMANFASALLFGPQNELPVGFTPDTYRTYYTLPDLAKDFVETSFVYKAAQRWLGGTPATKELRVWGTAAGDANITATLNKARNKLWWFFTFVTSDILAVPASVLAIAEWCEENSSFFPNNQTGESAVKIRLPTDVSDIATQLTAKGYRFTCTPTHANDGNSGFALMKHFAAVNYSGQNTTITGEFKKSPGVTSEDLDGTAYDAMLLPTKKATFYTTVDNQGSVDIGRWINTQTHSANGEFIDDVINLAAFVNAIRVTAYNTVANQLTKLGQDPVGQAVLLGSCKLVGAQYIGNGYLGPRNYIDPDDGIEKYTAGFEILSKAEDILDLSDADRDAHKSAPIRIRLFRKGSIHIVDIALDVY